MFALGGLNSNISLTDKRKQHLIVSVVTNWQPISIAGHQIKIVLHRGVWFTLL